jgi:hypothetical protein
VDFLGFFVKKHGILGFFELSLGFLQSWTWQRWLGTVEQLVYISEMNITRTLPSDKLLTFFLKPKLMLCAVNFHILRAITKKNQTNIFLLYYGYS